MDWSTHKFFVGLYGEGDGLTDLMVWMMNRFYYQRRLTVVDNDVQVNGAAVDTAVDFGFVFDSADCDQPHECKSAPWKVFVSIF